MGLFSKNKHVAVQNVSARQEYLLDANTPFSVTEAFRNLKASLSVSVPKQSGGRVIMATSAYPKEGKTMVTVNLVLMFAISDAKVILIDADIHKGRVSKFFKERSTLGLSDYLSGQCKLDEVVRPTQINPNLSYIACGTHSPKPYELLESEEMKALIAELRTKYDYVIIDTPPVLLISDALALVPVTDGTVLVCRHQATYVSDISRALSALQFAKANVLGFIVNDYKSPLVSSSRSNHKKYYYYSTEGYGYNSPDPETDEQ